MVQVEKAVFVVTKCTRTMIPVLTPGITVVEVGTVGTLIADNLPPQLQGFHQQLPPPPVFPAVQGSNKAVFAILEVVCTLSSYGEDGDQTNYK